MSVDPRDQPLDQPLGRAGAMLEKERGFDQFEFQYDGIARRIADQIDACIQRRRAGNRVEGRLGDAAFVLARFARADVLGREQPLDETRTRRQQRALADRVAQRV